MKKIIVLSVLSTSIVLSLVYYASNSKRIKKLNHSKVILPMLQKGKIPNKEEIKLSKRHYILQARKQNTLSSPFKDKNHLNPKSMLKWSRDQ